MLCDAVLNMTRERYAGESSFDFQIGGYLGSSHKVVYVGEEKLEYSYAEDRYEWGVPVALYPSQDQWDQFWRDQDASDVWHWEEYYQPAVGVCDGTYWSLELYHSGKSLNSEGSNAYPGGADEHDAPKGEFLRFLKAVQALTGIKELQ